MRVINLLRHAPDIPYWFSWFDSGRRHFQQTTDSPRRCSSTQTTGDLYRSQLSIPSERVWMTSVQSSLANVHLTLLLHRAITTKLFTLQCHCASILTFLSDPVIAVSCWEKQKRTVFSGGTNWELKWSGNGINFNISNREETNCDRSALFTWKV